MHPVRGWGHIGGWRSNPRTPQAWVWLSKACLVAHRWNAGQNTGGKQRTVHPIQSQVFFPECSEVGAAPSTTTPPPCLWSYKVSPSQPWLPGRPSSVSLLNRPSRLLSLCLSPPSQCSSAQLGHLLWKVRYVREVRCQVAGHLYLVKTRPGSVTCSLPHSSRKECVSCLGPQDKLIEEEKWIGRWAEEGKQEGGRDPPK